MKAFLLMLAKRANLILQAIFSVLPIQKNRIVLCSSPDFYDNAWAFYNYLCKSGKGQGYQIIWLVNDISRNYSNDAIFVSKKIRQSMFRRSYYLATAAVIIFTHDCPKLLTREGQLLIHTTHSASQLKAYKRHEKASEKIIRGDLILRCNQVGVDRFNIGRDLPQNRYAVIGMPSLDLLFEHEECLGTVIPQYDGNGAIVISMETFKQSRNYMDSAEGDAYAINAITNENEILQLNEYLREKDIFLLVKIHPMHDLSFLDRVSLSNIIYLTDADLIKQGIQLYQLVECCDALLTDYSSIYYDFLFLDRPIGFMVKDMEEYQRGFIIDDPLSEMPGDIIHEITELEAFLEAVIKGEDKYPDARKQLLDEVFKYQDSNNCKRLLDLLEQNSYIKRKD